MRLGFVTCHFPPDSIGGGQMQSLRLCEALSEKYDVTVFARSSSRELPPKEHMGTYYLQRRSVLKIPIIKSVLDLINVLSQIRIYQKTTKVYISFHIQLASLMVILAKHLYGTKAVVSPRGLEDFDFKWYKRWFQKLIYAHADIILIQSERIKEAFLVNITPHILQQEKENISKKIRIFPNGIRVPSEVPTELSERPEQIIFIGRLEPIKGIDTLLNAFRFCDQNIKLLIVGDGSQRKYLESCAKGLNVTFLGRCSETEVFNHLRCAKVLILPSLSENFPNVILEAFCAGVPVIGSRVGAIPELIEDGNNGFLVSPANTMALAEKINLIFQDKRKLDDMGKRAYLRVLNYDWNYLVNMFDEVVET